MTRPTTLLLALLLTGCGEAMAPDGGSSGPDAADVDLDASHGDGGVAADASARPDAAARIDAGPADADGGDGPDGGLAADGGAPDATADGGPSGSLDGATPDGGGDAATSECSAAESRACYGGPDGTLGVGACSGGSQRCDGGVFGACEGAVLPTVESCDGVDEDCDEQTDEELTAPPASTQEGVCAGATQVCAGVDGFVDPDFASLPGYQETEEGACDGLDNDCDGRVDEAHDADGDGYYDVADPSCAELHRTTARWDCDDSDPTRHACVIYVDDDAAGAGDGTSWADAYTSLRDALSEATAPAEVWIAQGTYRPDQGAGASLGSRAETFTPQPGVALYGGFAGTETERRERDPRTYASVLSGDLSGDDGPGFTNPHDNSHHVVTGASGVVLDGLIIRSGYADDASGSGGGLVLVGTSNVLVREVSFEANGATQNGGAVFVDGSNPLFVSTVFRLNRAVDRGAAIFLDGSGSRATVYNSVFNANTTVGPSGGAIAATFNGRAHVVSSTFVRNAVAFHFDWGSDAEVHGSLLWDNGASFFGRGDYTTPGNCANSSSSPPRWLVDPDGPDDVQGTDDDDLRPLAVSGCVDAGDATLLPSYVTTDIAGRPRFFSRRIDDGAHEVRWDGGCEPGADCPEVCDGVDDDADGAVDESPSDPPTCARAGACVDYVASCVDGAWSCSYPSADYASGEEAICAPDALDNDCDGRTDEVYRCTCTPGEDLGRACDGFDGDRCATGALSCGADGAPECVGDEGYDVSAYVDTRAGYDLERRTPGCAGGTELHFFSVYQPYVSSADPTPTRIDVQVQRTSAPLAIVVSSSNVAEIAFDVAPGATIEQVIVHGGADHTVTGLDASVPVLMRTGVNAWANSPSDFTDDAATLVTNAERHTGLTMTSWLSTYESDRYTIADYAP